MSHSNPLFALGAAVAVGALGAVVWSTQSADLTPDASIEARVLALETEVVSLRAQLAGELRGGPSRRGATPAGRQVGGAATLAGDVDLARSIARRARSAEGGGKSAEVDAQEPLQARVGELVREQLQEERDERWERRRERMEERTAKRLDQLAADAGLNPSQVDELEAALILEREEIMVMFRAAREDGSFGEARANAEAIKEATDSKVGELLDGTQRDAWDAYREEEDARRR